MSVPDDLKTVSLNVREDGIAVLTLNRPEARNALDMQLREELGRAIEFVRRGNGVRSLVITGAGGSFCAGGDLKLAPVGIGEFRNRMRDLNHWFSDLLELQMPVIAAVDGPAYGAGFNLALAADFILCSPRARFSQVFLRVGLVPDLGGLFLLPRMIGLQRAKELFYSAREIDANEALSLGIAYQVVPAPALLDTAIALAARFAGVSLTALGLTKSILNRSFETGQHALADLESNAQAIAKDSEAHRDALRRFREKQPPGFAPIEPPDRKRS